MDQTNLNGSSCDDGLDFYPFAQTITASTPPMRQNSCQLGVVTLDARGGFVSRRNLNPDELTAAWAEFDSRHPEG